MTIATTGRALARRRVPVALAAALALGVLSAPAHAQGGPRAPLPEVEVPPQDFATAEAHYAALLEAADGGTTHTIETVPQWGGLWTSGGNTMSSIFLDIDPSQPSWRSAGAPVREGVLTPAYEQHFQERRAEVAEFGEQRYDRLTNCEYPGVPRWLWEPYVKEFVNLPHQSWMMNDLMNETRRVYIGAEHVNVEGKHSATGDSIGFWNGDELVIWTKWVNPADYLRGMPLTSNQFEMVERWRQVETEDGGRQLVTQVTFYDPLALIEPRSAVYTHNAAPELEEVGVRVRNWECQTSSNSYEDEEGNTQFYLPGDPEYRDARGFTAFPELPGQSLDPMFEETAGAP